MNRKGRQGRKGLARVLSFAAIASFAVQLSAPAWASHEDLGFGARSSGLGEAATAAGDGPGAVVYNPALASAIAGPEVQAGARRAFQSPAGPRHYEGLELAAAAPLRALPWRGTLAAFAVEDRINAAPLDPSRLAAGQTSAQPALADPSIDRTLGLAYATHGWRETDQGVVDWGVSFKQLARSGRSLFGHVAKLGIDVGAVYRIRERFVIGASLLNVNGPRTDLGGLPDRAPVTARLGAAQVSRGFTMSVDVVKREPSQGRRASQSFGAGLERWMYTGLIGAVAARAGLNLAERAKTWSLGFAWRALGGQLDYAALVPIETGSRWGHAVSLVFRFGSWDPDKEFERLLGSEIRYRQELGRALDTAEVKQWKLAEELRRLRRELEDLQAELNTRAAGEAQAQQKFRDARQKIRELEEREQEAQRQLEQLEKDRKAIVEQSKESRFREDWRAYQKLKLQGAPDLLLLERVKQLLRQYKESGLDLSEANQELRRLLRSGGQE